MGLLVLPALWKHMLELENADTHHNEAAIRLLLLHKFIVEACQWTTYRITGRSYIM